MSDMLHAPTRYNISTGDARVITGDFSCYFDKATCFPLPCEIDTVWDTPSWYVRRNSGLKPRDGDQC